jgi:choline dehydrogenase-like flavoprotein
MHRLIFATESAPTATFTECETPPPGFAQLNSSLSNEKLDKRIRAHASTWYHPAGSVAIGKVLDAELRVIGVRGLRVCDASVFPVCVAGQLQCAVYAVAEKGGRLLLG